MSSITSRLASAKAPAVATGVSSSISTQAAAAVAHLMAPPEDCPTEDCKTIEVEVPKGAYLFINLKRLILSNGQTVLPDAHGLYVPKSEEEEQQLAWFESRGLDWCKKVG